MKYLLLLLLLIASSALATSTSVNVPITITATTSAASEEFVGPFASWMCAASSVSGKCGSAAAQFCNADSTGVADATAAIQSCINSLSSSRPVIYFPCGTYNVSATLTVTNEIYVSLVGQDNSTSGGRCTTTLKWTGANGGKLIYVDGVAYSQFIRLTFDGNSLANILVDQSCVASPGLSCLNGFFDTGNRYIDDVFKSGNDTTTSFGFRCGALNVGCPEVDLLRDTFSNLGFGVATCNANALNVWTWYSSFTNMNIAVSNGDNGCGTGGAPHTIGNIFSGSVTRDIDITGGKDIVDILDNYSTGSRQFAIHHGEGVIQRNTIIGTNLAAVAAIQSGLMAILDNTIENMDTTSPYISLYGSVLSVGNKFTNSSPYTTNGLTVYSSGDQTVAYAPPAPPTLPATPPNNNRTIYEAAPAGSGTACTAVSPCSIQTAICKASNGASSTFSGACTGTPNGLRNVAHAAAGTYSLSSTIVIPPNGNVQIIGDGWNSSLNSTANPNISLTGPSQATLRSFQFDGNGANDGLNISGVDQVGAYVYLRDSRVGNSVTSSLTLNGLSNVLVSADNFSPIFNSGSYDIVQSGSNHFNQYFGFAPRRSLSGAANGVFIGGWFESGLTSGPSTVSAITGTGSFVHAGSLFAPSSDVDVYDLNNFTGTFSLLGTIIRGPCGSSSNVVKATGAGAGGLIIPGFNVYETNLSPVSNTAGDTLLSLGDASGGVTCSSFLGIADSPNPITSSNLATIASTLQYFRSTKPMMPYGNPAGVSAIEMHDILTQGFATSIKLSP